MLLSKFSPPGHLAELSATGLERWSATLSETFDKAAQGDPSNPTDSPRAQFFNPLKTDPAADAKEAAVFWVAFPRTVLVSTPVNRDRWTAADSDRGLQDEYCEWAVNRDAHGKIQRVTFTSEAPEYWRLLAEDSPDRLLALYRELASPDVQMADLLDPNGRYNPRNKWNSGPQVAPVHMTQGSNTLEAAVELAAAATIVRVIGGQPVTSEQELIKCSGYGVPTRNSDPHIGASINSLARERSDVTLADPPGLYINDFTPAGFKTPDGTDPHAYWSFVRGEQGRWVRGVYEVPASKGYAVGDITIADQPIEFGAQLADFVSVKIVAAQCRIGQSVGKPFTVCKA
jgi:hypothetical protein